MRGPSCPFTCKRGMPEARSATTKLSLPYDRAAASKMDMTLIKSDTVKTRTWRGGGLKTLTEEVIKVHSQTQLKQSALCEIYQQHT